HGWSERRATALPNGRKPSHACHARDGGNTSTDGRSAFQRSVLDFALTLYCGFPSVVLGLAFSFWAARESLGRDQRDREAVVPFQSNGLQGGGDDASFGGGDFHEASHPLNG